MRASWSDANTYSNTDGYGNAERDSDGDRDGHSYGELHAQAQSYAETWSDPSTSPDAGTAPVDVQIGASLSGKSPAPVASSRQSGVISSCSTQPCKRRDHDYS